MYTSIFCKIIQLIKLGLCDEVVTRSKLELFHVINKLIE